MTDNNTFKDVLKEVFASNLIAVYGTMGAGKTLAVVAMLVELNPNNLVSNIKISDMDYEEFNSKKISQYSNKIIFIDMFDCCQKSVKENIIKELLSDIEVKNNHVILTIGSFYECEDCVASNIDCIIAPKYYKNKDAIYLCILKPVYNPLNKSIHDGIHFSNASKYFKFYNPLRLPCGDMQKC